MKPDREARLLQELTRKPALLDFDAERRRRKAIEALGAADSDRVFNQLLEIYARPATDTDKVSALRSLIRMRPQSIVPLAIEALKDEDSQVRQEAAVALGELHIIDAAPDLHAGLRHPDPPTRGACARALGQLRYEPAVPDLIALTHDPAVQLEVVTALGEIATPAADEALLADHLLPWDVWPHLIRIGNPRVLPRMHAYLKDWHYPQDQLQWCADCGEPSLERVVRNWERRWRAKLPRKPTSVRWGKGFVTIAPEEKYAWREDVLEKLQRCGWFDEVPPREASRIKRAVNENEEWSPALLAAAGFDAECIENDGDYKKWVLPAYEKASFGAIKFTKVQDMLDTDNEEATLSFQVGTRKYTRTFDQPDDYVWEGLHAFLNKAVAAAGHEKRFYELETGDQTAAIAFVRPQTFKRARRRKLV